MKEDFKAFYANLWDPELLEERLAHFTQHSGSENVQSFYDRIKRTALDVYGADINNSHGTKTTRESIQKRLI